MAVTATCLQSCVSVLGCFEQAETASWDHILDINAGRQLYFWLGLRNFGALCSGFIKLLPQVWHALCDNSWQRALQQEILALCRDIQVCSRLCQMSCKDI